MIGSCTSCTFHVSNIIAELRNLIQMKFKLIFFCRRSNFKNSCFVFHRGLKPSKTIKALGLRPGAFISFLVFETPMKHSHSFLKYYENTYSDNFLALLIRKARGYIYSGTLLIQPPSSHGKLVVLTGWSY